MDPATGERRIRLTVGTPTTPPVVQGSTESAVTTHIVVLGAPRCRGWGPRIAGM